MSEAHERMCERTYEQESRLRPIEELTKRGQVGRLRALGRAALAAWGMGDAELRLLGHAENTTFDVRAPRGRFMLRVARPGYRSAAELESEVVLLEHLARCWDGGVVPRPVRAEDGRALVLEGAPGVPQQRHCMLFEWVDGRICWGSRTEARVRALGRAQASLHEVLLAYTPPDGFTRPRGTAGGGYAPFWWRDADELSPDIIEACDAAHELAHPAFEALMAEDGAHGLIHYDMHLGNVLFRPGGEVGVIDFDDTTWAPLIMDAVLAIDSLSDLENVRELEAALLEGYRSVRLMPQRWVDAIPALTCHVYVNGAAWMRERADIPRLRDAYARYIPTLRGLIERELARAGHPLS